MIDTCVSAVSPGGYVLIVDITEVTNLTGLSMPPIKAWADCCQWRSELFSAEECQRLSTAKSLSQFSQGVEHIFGHIEKDCPVQWFRRVVDTSTTLGHKDCAISEPLLRILTLKYSEGLQASSVCCPWMFASSSQAEEFVLHKFGFLVERQTELDREEIRKAMTDYLGYTSTCDGRIDLDWALCGIAIRHDEKETEFDPVPIVNIVLIAALIALIVRICARLAYASDAVDETLGGAFWVACGAAAGIFIDVLKRRLVRRDR